MFSGALASRDFRLYVLGNFFTLNGVWIERVTLGWLAWDLTGSVAWTGAIGFLLFGPTMIGAPFFGVLADRINLPRAMIAIQLLQSVWAGLLLALLAMDALTIWRLAGVTFLVGATSSAYHPARMALAPLLVPKDLIAKAIPITATNFHLCRMTGPAIGGWIIAVWGVGAAVAVSAALYLPIIVALAFARPRVREAANGEEDRRFLTALAAGVRHAAAQLPITQAMAITLTSAATGRAATELLPAIADGLFGRGAAGLGQLTSAAGAGAVAATVTMVRLRDASASLPVMTPAAALATCALTAALGVAPVWWAALVAVGALGFTASMVGVGSQTIIQLAVDEGYRGRVMSLWTVVGFGGASLGALGLGALADLLGVPLAYALAGGCGALGLLAVYTRGRKRRG